MPKQKTHRGAAKRFKVTGRGKIKRASAFTSHLLGNKTTKQKRKARAGGLAAKADEKQVKSILGLR